MLSATFEKKNYPLTTYARFGRRTNSVPRLKNMKPLRNELGTNKVWLARYVAALFTSERDQAHLRDRDLSVIARF